MHATDFLVLTKFWGAISQNDIHDKVKIQFRFSCVLDQMRKKYEKLIYDLLWIIIY